MSVMFYKAGSFDRDVSQALDSRLRSARQPQKQSQHVSKPEGGSPTKLDHPASTKEAKLCSGIVQARISAPEGSISGVLQRYPISFRLSGLNWNKRTRLTLVAPVLAREGERRALRRAWANRLNRGSHPTQLRTYATNNTQISNTTRIKEVEISSGGGVGCFGREVLDQTNASFLNHHGEVG
jgi:hypothetical protein